MNLTILWLHDLEIWRFSDLVKLILILTKCTNFAFIKLSGLRENDFPWKKTVANFFIIFMCCFLMFICLLNIREFPCWLFPSPTGWWFQTCCFPFHMGCHPSHWLSYFSRWLNNHQPTNVSCLHQIFANPFMAAIPQWGPWQDCPWPQKLGEGLIRSTLPTMI